MTASAPTYPDWKAPAEDGKLLIWPEVRELSEQTLANHRALSSAETRVQGLPLRDVRAQMRQWIGHTNDDQPLLGSGHQTELYHPGVWVKDVMSNALAARMNGAAYHFAVDTDAPKHLELRWPGHGEPISDDPNYRDAHWCS